MADEPVRELTLYVQSKKVITSFFRPAMVTAEGANPTADVAHPPHTDPEASLAGEEAHFLSDDQARCVALAEEVAARRSYTVKVVDVAKIGRLERIVTERLRGVQTFPVLIGAHGERLEGVEAFGEERLCELMPTETGSLRAF